MSKRKIIMDCDPGHDDAIALLLAYSNDKLDVLGVTVTGGNQTLVKTLQNAKNVLEYAGVHARIAAGSDCPIYRKLEIAPEVHGESGLDGPVLPVSKQETDPKSAVELMRELIEASDEKVTIVATGPLTNVGLFIATYPNLLDRVEEIVIMGGAAIGGNWTAGAEFNILVDPEAARIVFNSGVHVVMCGLDVTHKALIYPEETEKLRDIDSKVAVMVAELLDFFYKFHKEQGFKGSPMHDPCAIAYLMNPEIFTTREAFVDIETKGMFTLGATVVDYGGACTGKDTNTSVCLDVERDKFFQLIYDAMLVYKERENI